MGVGNKRWISREKTHILVEDSDADINPPGQRGVNGMFVHLFDTRFGKGRVSE